MARKSTRPRKPANYNYVEDIFNESHFDSEDDDADKGIMRNERGVTVGVEGKERQARGRRREKTNDSSAAGAVSTACGVSGDVNDVGNREGPSESPTPFSELREKYNRYDDDDMDGDHYNLDSDQDDSDDDGQSVYGGESSAYSDNEQLHRTKSISASAQKYNRKKSKTTLDDSPSPSSAVQIHRTHQRKGSLGKLARRPPGSDSRLEAVEDGDGEWDGGEEKQSIGTSSRIPDSGVRITYRPGAVKATGKLDRLFQVYGADSETMDIAIWIRSQWIEYPAVPERRCLAPSPFWKPDNEVVIPLDTAERRQKAEKLQFEDAKLQGYFSAEAIPIQCILGPVGKYLKFNFAPFQIRSLMGDNDKNGRGFLLNVGGHVLSMDWTTNRPRGNQYLAISTLTDDNETSVKRSETPAAYDRRPSKSGIQIWRFPVKVTDVSAEDELSSKPLDTSSPQPYTLETPSIALMLCNDWGPARCLKWCPVKQDFGDPNILGYLAGVYSDGVLRVLKVVLPTEDENCQDSADACEFLKYTEPAFECGLPGDICTAVAWISNSELVAGCASGSVAAWDLSQSPAHSSSGIPFIPYLYHQIHHTYITSITTCYPSFPHTIATASMDGYSRMTNLLSPFADTIPNNRSRVASTSITYVDALHSIVSCEEGTWTKFFPIRRFFSSTYVCKHAGTVRCVAASLFHTFILTGGSNGEAVFCNPVRRLFHSKIKNYQQTWFAIEFSQHTSLLRLTEGFKLEEYETKGKAQKQLLTTVFPPEICISSVCWNGNRNFAGWAAAGSSCGLVRVQDVAIG